MPLRMDGDLLNLLLSDALANSQKATISFVISVLPSVRMEQLGSYNTDFYEL
jgi:hypothetical protein